MSSYNDDYFNDMTADIMQIMSSFNDKIKQMLAHSQARLAASIEYTAKLKAERAPPVTGGDATFVEATTEDHDDEDDVPASMTQVHHNFSTINQAFEDLVNDIQPDSDALDKLSRHLAHATSRTRRSLWGGRSNQS